MREQAPSATGRRDGTWTFITNHGAAMLVIAAEPDIRITDLAERLEISERATRRIVRDLVDGGYLTVERIGRRNHYSACPGASMRHPVVRAKQLAQLVMAIGVDSPG